MYRLALILSILVLVLACRKQNIFSQEPTQRIVGDMEALKQELTQAPFGWKVIYFPRTDSLLYSDPSKVYVKNGFSEDIGTGGFYFLMSFTDSGTVKMRADFDPESMRSQESGFEIKQNTYTQLSFTSYNYIHRLTNTKFRGSSDFLYFGKDFFGRLIFKTASYIEPAREYIIMEKLTQASDSNYLHQAYENRRFFDNMYNPQLCIRQGSRSFFQSDVFLRSATQYGPKESELKNQRYSRYYVFSSTLQEPNLPSDFIPEKDVRLGSGYCGTEKGISFYAGLRYNNTYVFYDFEKREAKQPEPGSCVPAGANYFACELVKVYDSINRVEILVPKHQAPNGYPTYFTAEIYDDTSSIYYKKRVPANVKRKENYY